MDGEAETTTRGRSLEELFLRFRGTVRGQLERIVGDYHDAEDLTQETFLRALVRWRRAQAVRDARRWLLAIARHAALDDLRRRQRARRAAEALPDRRPAPAADAERLLPALVARVERLPRNLALTLLLHGLDCLSVSEISRLLRTTPGNVKVRLHRARRLLARRSPWPGD